MTLLQFVLSVQVITLLMDVFCKIDHVPEIPKDPFYVPLITSEDARTKAMFSVVYPQSDPCPKASFAGSYRLPVGFMQAVMELLTVPKDVVLDYTVGDGSSYVAGELCGRFIMGLEDREILGGCAEGRLVSVLGEEKEQIKDTRLKGPDNGEDSDDEFIVQTRRQGGTSKGPLADVEFE